MHVFARRTMWYPENFSQHFVNLEKESIKSDADACLYWKDIMWYSPNFLNFNKESIKGYKNYYGNLPLGHIHQWLHNQTGYSVFKDKQNNLNSSINELQGKPTHWII